MISVLYFFWPVSLSSQDDELQLAFDVNRAALLQVFADDFGGALEGDQVVPLGLVLPVAFFVFDALGGGQREARDRHAAGGVLHFGILAQVAEQDDFVDALLP